jgi:hypothetical protein
VRLAQHGLADQVVTAVDAQAVTDKVRYALLCDGDVAMTRLGCRIGLSLSR